jgi:Domain of unknown function (DUF5625)
MNKQIRALLVCAITLMGSAKAGLPGPSKPPLLTPFAAQRAGSTVDTTVRIVEHLRYRFELRLYFSNSEQRTHLGTILGSSGRRNDGTPADTGLPIPVHLRIETTKPNNGDVVYEQEKSQLPLSSWGADSFSKMIDTIDLPPGEYRVVVQSLKDIPQLDGIPISLSISHYPGKTG